MLYVDDSVGKRVVPPAELTRLIDDSLMSMLPGIKPKLSLLNSIYELKDIPQLVGTHTRLQVFADKMRDLILGSGSLVGKAKDLRGMLRNALSRGRNNIPSDAYLAWKFGLAPMLSDVLQLQVAIYSIRRELNNLRQNANKKLISHYRAAIGSPYGDSDVTSPWSASYQNWFVGGTQGRRRVTYPVRQFNASMEYSYSLDSSIGDAEMEIRALADAFGVNFNPRILWAAIPWSFVVDWFVGVGRWLDQFKQRNIEPVTIITNYCWSQHIKRSTELFIGSGLQNAMPPMVSTAVINENSYIRNPAVPDFFRSIQLSGLDPQKFMLGAALAATR
jgi:hypothetical protein